MHLFVSPSYCTFCKRKAWRWVLKRKTIYPFLLAQKLLLKEYNDPLRFGITNV